MIALWADIVQARCIHMLAECCSHGKQLVSEQSNQSTATASQAAVLVWRTRELALELMDLEEVAASGIEHVNIS